jgi:hypothetical protein
MSDPKHLTDEYIDKMKAFHVLVTPQEAFDELCEQAKEANALREHVAALTDLDQFDIHASKLGIQGTIKGAGAGLMAAIIAKPLFDSDAPNYVEGRFRAKNPKTEEWIEFVHTVQKVTGKTPHEKRVEAEMRVQKLEAFIESMVAANGPYPYLNGHGIVADAYAVLRGEKMCAGCGQAMAEPDMMCMDCGVSLHQRCLSKHICPSDHSIGKEPA